MENIQPPSPRYTGPKSRVSPNGQRSVFAIDIGPASYQVTLVIRGMHHLIYKRLRDCLSVNFVAPKPQNLKRLEHPSRSSLSR